MHTNSNMKRNVSQSPIGEFENPKDHAEKKVFHYKQAIGCVVVLKNK